VPPQSRPARAEEVDVSERRACKVIEQPRSTQRYRSKRPEKDRMLKRRIHDLAERHPRFGYRQITALLRQDGWRVNPNRVHRLWKQSGLQVPRRRSRKRRRLGTGENGCVRLKAAYPNHVWSYDFLYDRTEDGRQLKIMPIVDEFTRECLAIVVGRSITAQDVVRELDALFAARGVPGSVRSDNGPEFMAEVVKTHLRDLDVDTRYIEPGAPWQNGFIESMGSRLRDELLDRELFTTRLEAQVLCERYRRFYNEESALDYQTPVAFAAGLEQDITLEPALALT
jgi:transposase InsO family protein